MPIHSLQRKTLPVHHSHSPERRQADAIAACASKTVGTSVRMQPLLMTGRTEVRRQPRKRNSIGAGKGRRIGLVRGAGCAPDEIS
jgi:hypothetical protein